MPQLISQFLSGGIMVGFLAIGFYFFRFWRKTRDSLFAIFAASFWVLALERILLLATATPMSVDPAGHELRPYVYWVRFFAFMLIIAGIYNKNRKT
jgi:hypothetical protein